MSKPNKGKDDRSSFETKIAEAVLQATTTAVLQGLKEDVARGGPGLGPGPGPGCYSGESHSREQHGESHRREQHGESHRREHHGESHRRDHPGESHRREHHGESHGREPKEGGKSSSKKATAGKSKKPWKGILKRPDRPDRNLG